MKAVIYGYCRISTKHQALERQIHNIRQQYPEAVIFSEACTGTKLDRPEFQRLLQQVRPGDTIVFDEVSRMSRNADDGFALYQDLFDRGVNLKFLKDPLLDTDMYRTSMTDLIDLGSTSTGTWTDEVTGPILTGVNQAIKAIQCRQFKAAFERAQAEVDYLHMRTAEGVRRAQAAGKQVGRAPGTTIETGKAKICKEIIRKHSKTFGGSLTDKEVLALCQAEAGHLARQTYYLYKKQLRLCAFSVPFHESPRDISEIRR